MAMNADVLGKSIANIISSFDLTTNPPPTVETMWIAISAEIIKHIQETAVVSTSVSTNVSTSVTTVVTVPTGVGSGVGSGSGSGNGSGSGSIQ